MLRVAGNMNEKNFECKGLIDTTATQTFLQTRFAKHLRNESTTIALAAQGEKLRITGREEAPVVIENFTGRIAFKVCNWFRAECILGHTWLTEQQANINLQRRCLHIGRNTRHTVFWRKPPKLEEIATSDLVDLSGLNHKISNQPQDNFRNMLQNFKGLLDHPWHRNRNGESHNSAKTPPPHTVPRFWRFQ